MPESEPRVTLAIPTWNGAAHLSEAIASCLAQPRDGVQLLLVDDGSVDDTLEIARRYEGEGLAIHRNAVPLGLAGNWNRCLSLARGEYVGLLHQDDRLRSGWLERAAGLLDREPEVGLVHAPHVTIDGEGRVRQDDAGAGRTAGEAGGDRALDGTEFLTRLYSGRATPFVCPGVLARRAVWEGLGGFDPRWRFALDLDMWLRVCERHDIGRLGEALVEYRRHDDQQTSREPSSYRAREVIAVKLAALARARAGALLPPDAIGRAEGWLADECVRFARRHARAAPHVALEHLETARMLQPAALRSVAAIKGAVRARLSRAAQLLRPITTSPAIARCPVCETCEHALVAAAGSTEAPGAVVQCAMCGLLRTEAVQPEGDVADERAPGPLRRWFAARCGPPSEGDCVPPASADETALVASLAARLTTPPRVCRHELQRQSDPLGHLRTLAGSLPPRGALLLVVPDATLYSTGRDLTGRRVLHFTPASLVATTQRAGLVVERWERLELRGVSRALGVVARHPARSGAGPPDGTGACAPPPDDREIGRARISLLVERGAQDEVLARDPVGGGPGL